MNSLGLNNPPRIGLTLVKSHVENKWCIKQRETVAVKWLAMNFTLLWQTALKCVPWHTVVLRLRIATMKIITLQIATDKSVNLIADYQRVIHVMANQGTLESGLPRGYSSCGKPRYWSTVCRYRVKSNTSHLISTVFLFVVLYLFYVRLYRSKT
jgi:hypothetical protein